MDDRNRTETGLGNRGETGGNRGQPQLTPWAAGIFPGLHYTTAGNIPLTLARGVSPGWSHPGLFLSALGPPVAGERGLGWDKNRPCQRADPPPTTPRNPVTRAWNF